MKKTLRNILTAGALGLASLVSNTQAEAQGFGRSLEAIKSEADSMSFLRPSLSYKNDAIDAYGFGEFYKGNRTGYFGKLTVSTELKAPIQPTAEVVYFGQHLNDIKANVGFGGKYSIPHMPKGSFLKLKALPMWYDLNELDLMKHKFIVGYEGGLDLLGLNIFTFGEMNTVRGNPQWGYGEVQLSRKLFGNLSVAYNPLLKNKDKALPRVEQAISASLKF